MRRQGRLHQPLRGLCPQPPRQLMLLLSRVRGRRLLPPTLQRPRSGSSGSPPSPTATPPPLAAAGMEAGDMDDVRVAAGRRGHQQLGRLRGRQEVHPPRSSLISSRAHVLPPRLPPLAARSQPPPCLHAAPPVLVSIAFWFLICFSFCWKKNRTWEMS